MKTLPKELNPVVYWHIGYIESGDDGDEEFWCTDSTNQYELVKDILKKEKSIYPKKEFVVVKATTNYSLENNIHEN